MDLLEGTDHTYTLLCDRERMFDHVEAWLLENFPVPATEPALPA